MLRMEFLYLGAAITLAAWLQGNQYAMWLAFLAFVLTFLTIKVGRSDQSPRRSLFSLPSRSEGRKKRPSKPGLSARFLTKPNHGAKSMSMIAGNGSKEIVTVAEQCHARTQDTVSSAVNYCAENINRNLADGTYVALMGAIGAM